MYAVDFKKHVLAVVEKELAELNSAAVKKIEADKARRRVENEWFKPFLAAFRVLGERMALDDDPARIVRLRSMRITEPRKNVLELGASPTIPWFRVIAYLDSDDAVHFEIHSGDGFKTGDCRQSVIMDLFLKHIAARIHEAQQFRRAERRAAPCPK